MTLEDHQTGKEIISPYLTIHHDGRDYAVNTETFRNCQPWLILPETRAGDLQHQFLRDGRTVPVFAVVGNYNADDRLYGITRTVRLTAPDQHRVQIGEIPMEILKMHIPNVWEKINLKADRITN